MLVGLLQLDLHIPSSASLKNKRAALKGLKDKIKNNFNVSVAEIDGEGLWQRSVVAVACVGKDKRYLNGILDKVVNLTANARDVELTDWRLEIL